MKVSVITIAFNAADTIEETIQSVLNQDYADVEFLLVDGGSTDRTLEIAKRYDERITKLISEPDNGIYDAMNKGLKLATGEVIAFLNADDVYAGSSVITDVVRAITTSESDTCYGDLEYVSRTNSEKIIRKWISGDFKKANFKRGWMPPHPAFFVKRKVYDQYGNFNTDLRTSADYELMLRFLYRHDVSSTYVPKVLVKMKVGGQSNQSIRNRIKANQEDRMAWKINGLIPPKLTFIMKPLRKVSQFWRR